MAKSEITAIVQARMASSRLPGKVLRELQGTPILNWVLRALSDSKKLDEVIVATTNSRLDDEIKRKVEGWGYQCFRGSEEDVLRRYCDAAIQCSSKHIVRITSDCPLVDGRLLDLMIKNYLEKECDYISNTVERTFPRGFDIEILSADALFKAGSMAKENYEREHVTPYIWMRPDQFRILHYKTEKDCSDYRVTIDTEDDLLAVEKLVTGLGVGGESISWQSVVKYLEAHPEIAEINSHISQKALKE